MGAVAHTNQNTVRQTVVDLGDGTYAVRLGGDEFFRVDADLSTNGAASWIPTYAGLGVENSLWAAVIEKAYTHFRSGDNTYASIASGLGVEALPGLNATSVNDKYFATYASGRAILDDIDSKLNAGRAITCGFDVVGGGAPVIPRARVHGRWRQSQRCGHRDLGHPPQPPRSGRSGCHRDRHRRPVVCL